MAMQENIYSNGHRNDALDVAPFLYVYIIMFISLFLLSFVGVC